MTSFYGIEKFCILSYPPDMLTAWIAKAMKANIPQKSGSNFRASNGLYVKTSDDNDFYVTEEE